MGAVDWEWEFQGGERRPRGGGTWVGTGTQCHCQTATRSGSGERQNLGTVSSFCGKKRGAVNFKPKKNSDSCSLLLSYDYIL